MLDLGRMGLKTVHPAALHGLESLKLLSMSENQLEQLPERFLEPVPNLRKLLLGGKGYLLNGNLLEELPAEFFAHTPGLTLLDVSENRLQRWSSLHLTKLKTLDLGMNRISQLPADAFQGLTALKTLRLNNNQLSGLPEKIFQNLTALEKLDLGLNDLSELPEKIFQNLTALKTLWLYGNPLSELPGICERIHCWSR